MSETKKNMKKVKTGMVKIKFLKDFGSFAKGDTEIYHASTAAALVDKEKCAEVVEELEKGVPKEAKK